MSAAACHYLLGNVLVVHFHGDIDLEAHPTVDAAGSVVRDHRTGPLVLDLTDVSFLDCSGARRLAQLARAHARTTDWSVAVVASGFIRRVVDLTGYFTEDVVVHGLPGAVRRVGPAAEQQQVAGLRAG